MNNNHFYTEDNIGLIADGFNRGPREPARKAILLARDGAESSGDPAARMFTNALRIYDILDLLDAGDDAIKFLNKHHCAPNVRFEMVDDNLMLVKIA